MTLGETVQQKIADWKPAGDKRHALLIPDGGSGWAIELHADRCDELVCRVWEITLRRTNKAESRSVEALQAWADRAARRVTSLLESLRVVEVDPQRNEALLRSSDPAQKEDQVTYFEVLLGGTKSATLRRFRAYNEPGHRREQISFALTHEALIKVLADLTADE
jgi:hypothetical protein